jgi:hypothetical protein
MTLNNVPTYLKEEVEAIRRRQSRRSSYTIPKGPLEKKRGERAKAKINAS